MFSLRFVGEILLIGREHIPKNSKVGHQPFTFLSRKNKTCILWCGKKLYTKFGDTVRHLELEDRPKNLTGKLFMILLFSYTLS